MKNVQLHFLFLAICLLALAGCGGGSKSTSPTTTSVSGVASKGLFISGSVKISALKDDGSKGNLLDTATIHEDGTYQANIGSYAGAVIAEASGHYMDEATGISSEVPEGTPLRAVLQNATGDARLAITPLTEIAVKKLEDPASGKIALSSIAAMNKLIAEAFHVADIVGILPADATAPATATDATTVQKEYALILAALSQMMADPANAGKSLDQVISRVNDAMESMRARTGMSSG